MEKFLAIFSKKFFITTPKVKAAEVTAVKKKTQKILHKILSKKLYTRKHKFAMPLCKRTDKNKIYNAIETTSNIPAGYYITAECTSDVEKFAQKLHGKFGHKDGPFYADEIVIKIFLHDLEHFLTDIYHTHFSFE